jgi:SAM-dependent methyltransferase
MRFFSLVSLNGPRDSRVVATILLDLPVLTTRCAEFIGSVCCAWQRAKIGLTVEMRWQTKCLLDTVKAVVPFQAQLRRLKDRVSPYVRDASKDANTIQDGLRQIAWIGEIVRDAEILEIGTGWQPMIPILFALAGARRVYMADMHRLLRLDTFRAGLDSIRENEAEIAKALRISPEAILHATRECQDMDSRMRELRLSYLCPCDCRSLPFNEASIDIVTSRAVLEHVPLDLIAAIFEEARRVLRPSGVMIHFIDNSDHWSHRDRRITAVNFLKFSDGVFRLMCINPQNYQNRLRHKEYLELFSRTGFEIMREESKVDASSMEALSSMRLEPRFQRFSRSELAATESLFLARPIRECARVS